MYYCAWSIISDSCIVNTKTRGNAASRKHYQALTIPIESTSEDEHQCRNPKSKHQNAKNNISLAQVIDLCSDAGGVPPLPHSSKDLVPPSRELNSTVSSKDDDTSLSNHATLPDDVQHPFQRGQQLLVERMRREKRKGREDVVMNAKEQMLWQEEEEEASNNASETIICPPPRKRLRGFSSSHSPVLIVPSRRIFLPCAPSPGPNETQSFPSSEESRHCPVPDQLSSSETEESTKLLQSVYDGIFQTMPHSEGDFNLCNAFSFKVRLPPHPTATAKGFEPFDMNSTPPPLLTPSFFERAKQPLLSLPNKSSRTKFVASNRTHK